MAEKLSISELVISQSKKRKINNNEVVDTLTLNIESEAHPFNTQLSEVESTLVLPITSKQNSHLNGN